jgi:hypothetical protein
VTGVVTAGLAESLASCRRVVSEVGSAASAAGAARGLGNGDGSERLAVLALEHAAAACAGLVAANGALAGLGVRDAFAPADFTALSDVVRPLPLPIPPTGNPGEVAAWWAGLSVVARSAFLQRQAGVAGALDGLPAAARDRANRLLLARALRRADPSPTALAVAAEIADQEAAGRTVQLHLFDEAGNRVALAVGDLDTAEAVAVLVPGIATTPDDDLDTVAADVVRAVDAARAAGAGSVAGVAWLGYRPPAGPWILSRSRAIRTGPVLAGALDGMAAARAVGGGAAARTTVLAHSYGTVVVDEAADAPGRLAADAVVLLGSPGMEDDAASLEAGEVFDAFSPADPISTSGFFGLSPEGEAFGAEELPVAPGTGHSGYLEPGPTLTAVGEVIAGSGSRG